MAPSNPDSPPAPSALLVGDAPLYSFSAMMYRSKQTALSAGLLVEAPTSEDVITVIAPDPFVLRSQDAWHLTPYLGLFHETGEALYYHGFLSYRMPTKAEEFFVPSSDFGTPNILMADGSVGYWLIRNPNARYITGLTSTLELHYSTTTEPHDPPSGHWGQTDHLDLTVGMTAILRNQSTVSVGFSFPLRNNTNRTLDSIQGPTDRLSDWTLMTQVNVYQW